jgi:hypothetical protein
MIPVTLPKAPDGREDGSSQVTFRIVDDADVTLLKDGLSDINIRSGDLLIILEQDGYTEIGEMFARRHDPNEKHKRGIVQELAELFEHLFCNSEWSWIPQDDENDISNGQHMFVDDYGEVRVLTGFWSDENAWRDDPLEKLFVNGWLVYTFHKQAEFSDEQFFDLPPGAQLAWERDQYDIFREIMDNAPPSRRAEYV